MSGVGRGLTHAYSPLFPSATKAFATRAQRVYLLSLTVGDNAYSDIEITLHASVLNRGASPLEDVLIASEACSLKAIGDFAVGCLTNCCRLAVVTQICTRSPCQSVLVLDGSRPHTQPIITRYGWNKKIGECVCSVQFPAAKTDVVRRVRSRRFAASRSSTKLRA